MVFYDAFYNLLLGDTYIVCRLLHIIHYLKDLNIEQSVNYADLLICFA